jgi:5'-methylthioadenosine phosphorylase
LITDYDCWHESEAPVTLEMVLQNLAHNTELARGVIRRAAAKLPDLAACSCRTALKNAIVTSREIMPLEVRTALQPIIGKYFK